MTWLYHNINHFTAPLGFLLGLFAAVVGYQSVQRQKAGLPPNHLSRRTTIAMVCVILVCCFLLGVAFVRVFVRI